MMTRTLLVCVSVVTLGGAFAAAWAGEQSSKGIQLPRSTSSARGPAAEDCEARIEKLNQSDAEGEERLNEKNDVIEFCADEYAQDKTINRLVDECAKYEEQPVLKQQFVAECQLAAFGYANALRTLKMEYGK